MSLRATTFYFPKTTGTHADALAVAGLGTLLARIGPAGTHREVLIQDRGPWWQLSAPAGVAASDVDTWDGDPFYPYVRLKNDGSERAADEIDYEAERVRQKEAREATEGARKAAKKRWPGVLDAEREALAAAAVAAHPETELLARFNQLRSGFKGDIELHRALRANPPRDAVKEQLQALASSAGSRAAPANDVFDVSTSQWFVPLGGKGTSEPKPGRVVARALPPVFTNGFDAWLRCIGMYRALTAHTLDKDLRVAVLHPGSVDASLLEILRSALRRQRLWGRLADVRAPLALARALVENSEEYRGGEGGGLALKFARRRPRDVVRGLDVSTYKKMGTASALMNIAFLGTPSWAAIGSRSDAEAFLDTLQDLDRIVGALDEKSDVELLRSMARFVSSGQLGDALAFFSLDAATQMSRAKDERRRRKPWRVSTTNLERILMGTEDRSDLQRIIHDDGFAKLAKAIRASTIHAQLHADSALKPRYGLAQAWRQHAGFKDRFVQELSAFVASYNGEIVRERESRRRRGDPRPVYASLVTDDDLTSVLGLIEAAGSQLVAHLLLAFGFSEVRGAGSPNTAAHTQENE